MPDSRAAKPEPESETNGSRSDSPRKPYRKPTFSLYGSVAHLTRGNASNMPGDAGGGSTKMGCWIAEALYGVDAPRTHLVRAWLNDAYERRIGWAVVVMPLYRRYGVGIARRVPSSRLLQRLLRPVFDFAVRRAHRRYASYLVGPLRTSMSPSA
jgi:hypothetical protein